MSAYASVNIEQNRFEHSAFETLGFVCPEHIGPAAFKRQAEYLAGRLCARTALESLGAARTELAANSENVPQWPAGYCGSITHSKGRAAAICASDAAWRSLGLDLELMLLPSRASRLQSEILTPSEAARFSNHDTAALVTTVFSLKESLFKALYPLTRKRFYFQDAEILALHPTGIAQLRLCCDLSSEWTKGRTLTGQFTHLDGYLLSLVAVPAA
jgi:enterobactin synthetase component D